MNGINTTIKYCLIEPLSNMHTEKIFKALNACLYLYNHNGHTVTEIWRDKQFETIMDTVKDKLGVQINYTATG